MGSPPRRKPSRSSAGESAAKALTREPELKAVLLIPAAEKIGEGQGNLRDREAAFTKRRGES